MANPRNGWTIEDVAARFEEAASTGRRLPPVRVQGYFNCCYGTAPAHHATSQRLRAVRACSR